MKQARISTQFLRLQWVPAIVLLAGLGCSVPTMAQESSVLARLELDLKQLIEKVKPSVVTVSARRSTAMLAGSSSGSAASSESGPFIDIINIGSGIVLDSIHILTHAGITANCDSIDITYFNGDHSRAQMVGIDQETGLAVLSTRHPRGRALRPAPLRLSQRLGAGNMVALVGNTYGVSSAITLGVVNGVREDGILQISTPVAAGNAGSPLFDYQGRLAAILAGRVSPVGDDYMLNEGLSFSQAALAYPAADVVQRIQHLIYGTAGDQGWIGVSAEDWPGGMGWVHISDVKYNGPAHQAGLKVGDIVFSSDQRALRGARMLAQTIRTRKPGSRIELGVLRGDSTYSVRMAVGKETPELASGFAFVQRNPALNTTLDAFEAQPVAAGRGLHGSPEMKQRLLLQRMHQLERELEELRLLLKNESR